ncbi:MAG: PhnD/SsuA/transferrin family substrate-binding protein [Rubrivivax sp.]|nr:PhnD/SsuA/transferrin family substrate-binding protein [Rubrivivax sp.]
MNNTPNRRQVLLATAAGPALLPGRLQASETLRLGLAPYLSPPALMATFRPVREQLSQRLGLVVETYTARDFRALADAVRRVEFDAALLPAHLARVAVADWAWAPLARTIAATPVLVLVRGAGPVRTPADLRGARVGMLDLLSLTAAVGARWLDDQGLSGPDGATVQTLTSINSALYALERDEVAAVVAAASQLQGLPAQTPAGQRSLARVESIPGPMYVARPGLPAATLARWQQAWLALRADLDRPATAANAVPQALTAADLAAIEPYAAFLRRQLAATR